MQCPSSNEKRLLRTAWNSSSYMGGWPVTSLITLSSFFSVLPQFRLALLSSLCLHAVNILTMTLCPVFSVFCGLLSVLWPSQCVYLDFSHFMYFRVACVTTTHCYFILFSPSLLPLSHNSCSIHLAFPGQYFLQMLLFTCTPNNFEFWKSCTTFHTLSWHLRFFNLSLNGYEEYILCFINTLFI